MSITNNKKGFTLVELLAVIVILALIMSIAIVSMTGIMENARYSTFNDTARSIISGVRSQLLAANELRDGDYYFTSSALQGTGKLPFGGKIKFHTKGTGDKEIGTGIIRAQAAASCEQGSESYVHVENNAGNYVFSICIGVDLDGESASGVKWMNISTATETNLQNDSKAGITDYTTGTSGTTG